ncbi:cellulose-binding protein, partial [Wangella sp. NEAU-J3]|nr:cellulose-binding protein [Jidongwangia harbinensis]
MSTYVGRSKLRVAVVAAVSVSVLAVGAVATFGPRSASARAAVVAAAGVEDEGANCVVPEPGGAVSNARLPDPFLRMNGTRITSTG